MARYGRGQPAPAIIVTGTYEEAAGSPASLALTPTTITATAVAVVRLPGPVTRALTPATITVTPQTVTLTSSGAAIFLAVAPSTVTITSVALGLSSGGTPPLALAPTTVTVTSQALSIAAGTAATSRALTPVTITVTGSPLVAVRRVVATPIPPSVDDILNGTTSLVRVETFRFDAHDVHGNLLGPIAIDRTRPPTIANQARSQVRRTMSGMVIEPRPPGVPPGTTDERGLPWYYADDIDSLTMRVHVWWVLENTGDELPYGVFLFSDDNQDIHTYGNPRHCEFDDQCALLVDELPQNFGFATGTNVGVALASLFATAGITDFSIDSTNVVLSAPVGWTIDRDTLMTAFDALCLLAGFLPVYFNNAGRGICRAAPDLQTATPTFSYGLNAMMVDGSIVLSRNLLKIPNRWRVMDSSGSELVGSFDIPDASPNSITNRKRVIAKTERVPGLGGPTTDPAATRQARADATAKALYVASPTKYATLSWSTPPDPRHDTFDPIGYGDVTFMQLATSLVCAPGGRMSHEASGSLVPV